MVNGHTMKTSNKWVHPSSIPSHILLASYGGIPLYTVGSQTHPPLNAAMDMLSFRDITQFIMEMLRDRKEPIPPSDLLDAARCNVKLVSDWLNLMVLGLLGKMPITTVASVQ